MKFSSESTHTNRVVTLTDWSGFLGTRHLGARIREKAESILSAREATLVLDWSGVNVVTQSFADELVGKLASHLGREAFLSRVCFLNLDPSVRSVVRYVAASRLDEDETTH